MHAILTFNLQKRGREPEPIIVYRQLTDLAASQVLKLYRVDLCHFLDSLSVYLLDTKPNPIRSRPVIRLCARSFAVACETVYGRRVGKDVLMMRNVQPMGNLKLTVDAVQ